MCLQFPLEIGKLRAPIKSFCYDLQRGSLEGFRPEIKIGNYHTIRMRGG